VSLSDYITSQDIDELENEMEEENMTFNTQNYLMPSEESFIEMCLEAQKKLCADKQYPHFAPYDGVCYRCRKQIYERISLQRASSDLITGCPWCSRSYCD